MTPILHAVHIVTLATWLSIASFGSLGMAVSGDPEGLKKDAKPRDPYENLESIVLTDEFTPSELPASQSTDPGSTGEAEGDQSEVPFTEQETVPTPPSMPDVADLSPLPELPDPPAPSLKIPYNPTAPAIKPHQPPEANRKLANRSVQPDRVTGGSPQGEVVTVGKAGHGGRNGETGLSDAKRLGGGRMPAPSYPAEARAKGQSGTVIVEFIVGEDGSVISANAKRPSPWPLLNERAVSCVQRWKFPPGSVTKYTRPIVFKLN